MLIIYVEANTPISGGVTGPVSVKNEWILIYYRQYFP